jgi:hypothetical protein
MRRLACLCLLIACSVRAAGAESASKTGSAPPPASSPAAPQGTNVRSGASAAPAPAKPRATKTTTNRSETQRSAPPRTLEDIHIEGEIPVPQVLFVTVRDQRRFTQFHHRRYLKTSQQLGEATPLPKRIAVNQASTEPKSP